MSVQNIAPFNERNVQRSFVIGEDKRKEIVKKAIRVKLARVTEL